MVWVPKTSSGAPTRDDAPERTSVLRSDLRPTFGSTCGETRSGWRTRNPGQQSNWSFWHPQAVEGFDPGLLPRAARIDEDGVGAVEAAPVAHRVGDELGSVVESHVGRCPTFGR